MRAAGRTDPPGVPDHLRGRLVEVARREWVAADSVDLREIEAFLVGQGAWGRAGGRTAGVVGAALLLGGDIRTDGRSRAKSPIAAGIPAACAVVYTRGAGTAVTSAAPARIGEWVRSWTPGEHAAAVSSVRAAIARGDVYQVNIVGHRSAAFSGDPAAAGAALAHLADTPYAGSLSGDGWSVCSASPEALLEIADGVATTRPIKGTVAVAADPVANEIARTALARSAKDRAEHVMIVDLARNDLGRVADIGGVTVPELYAVRQLAGVWHAESTVRAQLRPGVGLADVLGALFPGGSVTGAPKLAALDIIGELEPVGRGPSMGALGWIGADGDVRLGLTIRTVAITRGRIHLWTGGGVTWGSDPEAEVAEADVKAAPLLAALAAGS